jgi:hypothetical protein
MKVELPEKLPREGTDVLAIPVGLGRNDFVLTKFADLRAIPGRLVRDGEVEEWRLTGFFKHQERLYLYGPFLKGRFLSEVIEGSWEQSLPYLIRLVDALLRLAAQELLPEYLQADAVHFPDEGGVLFLPLPVMREARNMLPVEHRLGVYESINHPDFKEPKTALSFGVAALLYRAIRGEYPFLADSEEEVHNRARYRKLPSLELELPGLRRDLAGTVAAGLGRGSGAPPSLESWRELLESCRREGIYRQIGEEERAALQAQARKEQERLNRSYRQKVFWQRNWKTVLIVAVAVVGVGIVAGSFLKNALAPRPTHGFPPRKVVETFYESMNTLDHTLMEACVVNGAGKGTINEVMNLYVLSRVSLGYEGRSHIIPADQWVKDGKPPLSPPDTLYGVTDLQIQQLRGEPEPEFLVHYVKWFPKPSEDQALSPPAGGSGEQQGGTGSEAAAGPAEPTYESRSMEDRVQLRQDRGDWVIFKIESSGP